MPTEPARILVVDDDIALAELLRRVLTQEGHAVETAHSAEEALAKSQQASFTLAILDVMLPGMDGYTLCRKLRRSLLTRHLPILMLTAKGDIADKISGFEAGADDYLTKPFQPKELAYRVRSLLARSTPLPPPQAIEAEQGRVLALFSCKGGVGKTTIATNLAIALHQQSGKRVALVDADFFFGDVGVHLNLPTVRTILDLLKPPAELDATMADQALVPHPSGIRVLLNPLRPEEIASLTAAHLETILGLLAQQYDWVVVDCQPSYDDRMLRVLALADDVLLVVTPEVGPLKNTSLFLDWAAKHGYAPDKISVLLNRFNSNVGIGPEEIERTLQHEVTFRVVSGGRPVVMSVNRGVPLLIEQPEHPFCAQLVGVAESYLKRTGTLPVGVGLPRHTE